MYYLRSSTLLADALVYGVALYAVGREATLKRRAARLCGWLQVTLAVAACQYTMVTARNTCGKFFQYVH